MRLIGQFESQCDHVITDSIHKKNTLVSNLAWDIGAGIQSVVINSDKATSWSAGILVFNKFINYLVYFFADTQRGWNIYM